MSRGDKSIFLRVVPVVGTCLNKGNSKSAGNFTRVEELIIEVECRWLRDSVWNYHWASQIVNCWFFAQSAHKADIHLLSQAAHRNMNLNVWEFQIVTKWRNKLWQLPQHKTETSYSIAAVAVLAIMYVFELFRPISILIFTPGTRSELFEPIKSVISRATKWDENFLYFCWSSVRKMDFLWLYPTFCESVVTDPTSSKLPVSPILEKGFKKIWFH